MFVVNSKEKMSDLQQRLHIVFVSFLDIWTMGKGKGAPSFYRTLKGYADRGHQVTLLLPQQQSDSVYVQQKENNNWKNEIHPNINVIQFHLPFWHWQKKGVGGYLIKWLRGFLFQFVAFPYIRRIHQKKPIDIIYGHESHAVLAAFWGKILLKIPFSIARFKVAAFYCLSRKKKRSLKETLLMISYLIEPLAMKLPATRIIMTNDGTEGDKALQQLRVSPKRIYFWRNGIDKNQVENEPDRIKFREKLNLPLDQKIVLSACRLTPWKGVHRLIAAIPEVIEEIPQTQFIILGDGEEKINLENQAKKLNISEHVTFLGAVSHPTLFEYMQAADLFVSLYDYSNLGNPIFEAMISYLPVITLDVGATRDIFDESENDIGVLLQLQELSQLPQQMIHLLKNDTQRIQMGKNGHHYITQSFQTWDERIQMEIKTIEQDFQNVKRRHK